MRKLVCLTIALVVAGCSGGSRDDRATVNSPQPVALTSNLDFESGPGEGDRPADWSGGGEGYELAVDTAEKHAGAASARIRQLTPSQAPNAFGTMTKCTNAGPLSGAKIAYAGFIKTADVSGWAGMWFRVDGPKEGNRPKQLGFDNMRDRPVKGTTDWARYEIIMNVPTEAVQVCFGFLLAGGGTVWADDLSVARGTG